MFLWICCFGTVGAISIVRRMFDAAYATNNSGLLAVLLDWAKAFDTLKPDVLILALQRFGIPAPMVAMIEGIYCERWFSIWDACGNSSARLQRAGIAQGFPLSPYLFILVQTVLLADVEGRLSLYGPVCAEPEFIVCTDLLYADDTILLGNDTYRVQAHYLILIDEGRKYGLELNATKTVMMRINHTGSIYHESGEAVNIVEEAVYLGGLITSTANARPELTRRLGEAKSVYKRLHQCWSHANIRRKRKIQLYNAIVLPNLIYNLESIWLNADGINRLNAFHFRYLRHICRIQPSFISRVPNRVLDYIGPR